MNKIVIGYVSKANPYHDRVAWSGTTYKVREAIEFAGFDVVWIPYGQSMGMWFYDIIIRIFNQSLFRHNKWLGGIHFKPYAKACAKNIEKNPLLLTCDYLFFPGGAQLALFLKKSKPFIYLSDSTVDIMLGYYYKTINKYSRKMASEMNCRASQLAKINIRASQWAINSLINDYSCDKSKCHLLEFGPNFNVKDIAQNEPYYGGELRILFSGVNWNRKGGDIAVKIVELLRRKGINVKLIVAGPHIMPTSCNKKDYIVFVGYLNKNNPYEYKQYLSLYNGCHIFLLPTRAECSAIVYSEASALGLPCYTYLTGGTCNYVIDGVNGYALPEGSSVEDFVKQIFNDVTEKKLPTLREGALSLYKEKLSWEVWARKFSQIMKKELMGLPI